VRGRDVYIVQSVGDNVNDALFELQLMAYACKTAAAHSIIGVIPYLPYSRQCKMRKRGSIVAKLMAQNLSKSGFCHIITLDLHQKEIQGFFECPVDNLRKINYLHLSHHFRF
jgi:phosphoribosylpyrophosphate synthetase